MRESVVVLGAGGHAAVVLGSLLSAGRDVLGLFDDDEALIGTKIFGVPVLGRLSEAAGSGASKGVVAIGDNRVRSTIAASCRLGYETVIHQAATIAERSVEILPGAMVMMGAMVQPRVTLGAHVIVNTGAIVDHDCWIGEFAHVASGATLCGGVLMGTGSLVGAASVVAPGVKIGDWARVGAGAAVVADVPNGATVIGVPAKPIGQ